MSLWSWCQLLLTCPMHQQASQALPDQRSGPSKILRSALPGQGEGIKEVLDTSSMVLKRKWQTQHGSTAVVAG